MNETTGVQRHEFQTDVQDEAKASHGRRCRMLPSSLVDTEQSPAHRRQQAACHYTLSSQQSLCCETGDTPTVTVASDHCYPGKTAAGFERLSPITWRVMVGLTHGTRLKINNAHKSMLEAHPQTLNDYKILAI